MVGKVQARVTELHRERYTACRGERYAILSVEFDAEEFESHCKQNGIIPNGDALLRCTRLRAMEYAGSPATLVLAEAPWIGFNPRRLRLAWVPGEHFQ